MCTDLSDLTIRVQLRKEDLALPQESHNPAAKAEQTERERGMEREERLRERERERGRVRERERERGEGERQRERDRERGMERERRGREREGWRKGGDIGEKEALCLNPVVKTYDSTTA